MMTLGFVSVVCGAMFGVMQRAKEDWARQQKHENQRDGAADGGENGLGNST